MITVRQVKVYENEDILSKIAKKLKINDDEIISFEIIKKSLDARDKDNIFFVYEVDVDLKDEKNIRFDNDIIEGKNREYNFIPKGNIKLNKIPVIVGSGPAGLFCALILLENGIKPIIIDRGKKISERSKDVQTFWDTGILNEESNVQYGEGGAGTFSDGKLNTLIKDKDNLERKVLSEFVKYGANKDIMYENKPHIGTDKLKEVITNMREDLEKKGIEFRFNSKLTNIILNNNSIEKIEVNENEYIDTDMLILAIGNSSRDTIKLLKEKGINIENKPIAVGLRIIHPQNVIDRGLNLLKYSPGSYKLTYTTKDKVGVYTFCMCPGGYVVNASSKIGYEVVNGMSFSKRDNIYANSAIVVNTNEEDNLIVQEDIEKKAFEACNGKMPVQYYQDFVEGKVSILKDNVKDMLKGKYESYDLNKILPLNVSNSIKEAIINFDKKLNGFKMDDALLVGVETRTSSPVRIIRNENFESNIKGIYPIGEGSGYSGGIVSSAIDGIKCAQAILNIYK